MDIEELTRKKANRVIEADRIEGASAIADELGVSPQTVQRWARTPEIPIYKPAGRIWASRSELKNWLKSKPS